MSKSYDTPNWDARIFSVVVDRYCSLCRISWTGKCACLIPFCCWMFLRPEIQRPKDASGDASTTDDCGHWRSTQREVERKIWRWTSTGSMRTQFLRYSVSSPAFTDGKVVKMRRSGRRNKGKGKGTGHFFWAFNFHSAFTFFLHIGNWKEVWSDREAIFYPVPCLACRLWLAYDGFKHM